MVAEGARERRSKLRVSEAGKQGGRGNQKPSVNVSEGFSKP
jgi:hypothetical protein